MPPYGLECLEANGTAHVCAHCHPQAGCQILEAAAEAAAAAAGAVPTGDEIEPEPCEVEEPAPREAPSPAAAAPAEAAGQAAERSVPFTIFAPLELQGNGLGSILQFLCTAINKSSGEDGRPLAIDLTNDTTPYDSWVRPGCGANWFTDIWRQTFYLQASPESARIIAQGFEALREARYKNLPGHVGLSRNVRVWSKGKSPYFV